MRLIDVNKLKNEAEHCIETTGAFQELIDNTPTAFDFGSVLNSLNSAIKSYSSMGSIAHVEALIFCKELIMGGVIYDTE